MPAISGPFPPTPVSSLRSKVGRRDVEQSAAGPSKPRIPPPRLSPGAAPTPEDLSPSATGMYTPTSEYSEPQYRTPAANSARRPHSNYPSTDEPVYHPHRKYTDPTPQTGGNYSMHEPSSPVPASSQHQLDVDLDVYSQDYNELEDDQRQPTLSFATTSTVDSSASSPSITDAYTYSTDRGTEGGKYEQHEPRIRMRTGRQNAYSSAESSLASGAFSYHAYSDNAYLSHPPPMPVAPSDIGRARSSDYIHPSSAEDVSLASCQAVSPNSPYAQHQPWRSPVMNRERSESISTSETTDSSAEDQVSVGFAHSFSYLSGRVGRRSWDEGPAPVAVALVDDGRSAILDQAKLEFLGGPQVLCSMTQDEIMSLPRFTHLLLSGVGEDILSALPLLLDVLSTTLVVLDVSNNHLTALPSGLRHCAALEELNVSGNPLRQLPIFLGECTNLRMLAADGCLLQSLPFELSQLYSLHTLLLRNNRLIVLPTWLYMLHHLEVLRIDNNPFAPQWMAIVAPILASTSVQANRSRAASYSQVRSPSQQSNMRPLTPGMNSLATSQSSVAGPSSSTDSLGLGSNGSRPGPGPVQSLRTTRPTGFGSRPESPLPPVSGTNRMPQRSVSGPTPSSDSGSPVDKFSPLTGGAQQRRVRSGTPYLTDESESESADLKAGKWGFLRKVSLSRLRTEKDRSAQLSASAAANVATMPLSAGPTISSPVLIGNMPRRPPLASGWSTNMLPTRVSGVEHADLNASTSSAPGSVAPSSINLPGAMPNFPASGRTSRANKRRSFLPIDPSPPSLNVAIPSTSPFMAPQATLSEAEHPYMPGTAEDAMETLGEETDSNYEAPYSASSCARPESEYSLNDETRYARGLESIKSYLRDLYDLSLPPAEPYGGFEVLEGNSTISETASPTAEAGTMRASVAESNGSARNNLQIDTALSRAPSMVSSGSERYSKFSTGDTPDPMPVKRCKDDKAKRARVVREIYETEKTYVRGLNELVSIYVRPASQPSGSSKSSETVIPVAERKVVFGGVESILLFHRDNFLPALEKVVHKLINEGDDEDGSVSALAAHQLGEIFRTYIAYMKQYSTYINNFDNALARMKSWVLQPNPSMTSPASSRAGSAVGVAALGASLVGSAVVPNDAKPHSGAHLNPSQRKRVKHFLKRAKENSKHSQINLESYLLLPVQRVPRYKLLLEDLAACTPPRESIGPNDALDDAILEIAKLASLMNEEKREAESRLRLLHWQQRITSRGPSPLVQPHRKLVLDGALQLIRVVKKASSYVEVDASPSLQGTDGDLTITGTKAVIPVEYIKPEPMDKPIMLILCSDMLVLVQQRSHEGWDGQVDLFSVLRMATLREPASVSASNDRVLRVVDNRSIYYFNGGSHSTTLQWCRAINQQNRR